MSDAENPDWKPDRKPGARANRLREREAKAAIWRRLAVVALALLASATGVFLYGRTLLRARSTRPRAIEASIPAGGPAGGSVWPGSALERAGIVRSGLAFDLYARWRGEEGQLRPGRYTLSPSMTPAQIVHQLELGPGHSPYDIIHVVVPEGFTVKQIAARLEKLGVTDGMAFLQAAMNPRSFLKWSYEFPRPDGPLEGYLYPATYDFLPNTPAEKVLDGMLLNFSERFFRPYHQQIVASGRTLHKVVTVASLIEREAKTQEDRPRIAGVLENRLKKRMKLEIDATVLYALGRHKQRVYFKDLRVDSPYNTYRHAGLPPGPIASPGTRSLQAALAPEKNDFLYYVARPNGSHYFTRTRLDHEAAILLARSERAARGGVELETGGKSHEP